jgi:cytochrome c553
MPALRAASHGMTLHAQMDAIHHRGAAPREIDNCTRSDEDDALRHPTALRTLPPCPVHPPRRRDRAAFAARDRTRCSAALRTAPHTFRRRSAARRACAAHKRCARPAFESVRLLVAPRALLYFAPLPFPPSDSNTIELMTKTLLACALTLFAMTSTSSLHAADTPAKGDAKAGKALVYTCGGCHGVTGYMNAYPNYHVPRIAGQNYDYLVAAITEYKSGERAHPTMRAQGESLSEQDIRDIAAYLTSISK